jgi:LmbE family N-acetylglucosaminyl deacetylase
MSRAVRVLVVVAHPDDAELAIGGAIGRWCDQGHEVTVGCCSVSERTPELALRRRGAAEQAARILGHRVHWVTPGDVQRVEDVPEHRLVALLDALVSDLGPDVVVSHWGGDPHRDHRQVASAVVASARTWPDVALLQLGPSEHRSPVFADFAPTVNVPMADQLARKSEALAAYDYSDHSFRPLDVAGGATRNQALGSQIGVPAAEGLQLLRVVAGTRGATGLACLLGAE